MSIGKKDLHSLLEDQLLQDSFHQLSYIKDYYGFNQYRPLKLQKVMERD